MASLLQRALRMPPTIRDYFADKVGRVELARFTTNTHGLPGFRYVDVYNSADWFCSTSGLTAELKSEHGMVDLNTLLHDAHTKWVPRAIKQSAMLEWQIDVEAERYFPVDQFWLLKGTPASNGAAIVRVSYDQANVKTRLEVASASADLSARIVKAITDRSISHSIYRGRILELAFAAGMKDEYGDVEKAAHLRVQFKRLEPIGEDDIIIDADVRGMLMRNIVDLHRRRDVLKANGVAVRRGVLLYGPPGTGKTFACRYVFGKLTDVTRIGVTGTALTEVSQVFSLARLYQPSLVLFEDVDLVFASREINLYSSVLGEMLDQMDGLRPFEDIGFLLTTNSIERMEAAIKDRPGRISQCIYLGPPEPSLRRRYLSRYLQGYDVGATDLDALVEMSDGATQALLKEWVQRSVQIATERLTDAETKVQLRTTDFREAMEEMQRFTEGSTRRIIGFIERR